MFNIKALNESLADVQANADALTATAESEEREFTEEETKQFDAWMSEGEKITAQIARAEKHEAIKKTLAAKQKPEPQSANEPEAAPKVPAVARHSGRLKAFRGPDAEKNAYISGNWIAANFFGNEQSQQFCRDNGIQVLNAHTGGNPAKGGVLVPTEMRTAIIDLREEYGVFRQWADVRPMSSDVQTVPVRTSGLTAYAVGDNDEITASELGFGRVELVAKKWGALSKFPTELGEDAFVSFADRLAGEMAYAFANKEDLAGFVGDGTSTYHGVVGAAVKINDGTHTASVVDAATGNDSFEELDLTDFEKVVGALPQFPGIRPAWFISKVGYYASMARLMDAAGGNTKDDVAGGTGLQFLGYPVVISQVLNSTLGTDASAIKCLFGDMMLAAAVGDRRNFTLSTSADRYFETDEIGVKSTVRTAINVHQLGDNSDAGPLLALKSAS